MSKKRLLITLLLALGFVLFASTTFAQVYGGGGSYSSGGGGGGGGGGAVTTPTQETQVSSSVTTSADKEANNSITENKATVVTEEPSLFKTFSVDFINNVNTKLDAISFGTSAVQVTLPQGALNRTLLTSSQLPAGATFTVEVTTVPVAQVQQQAAAQGVTVLSAIQVNLNVVTQDGSTRISQLGAPVTLQLNKTDFFAGLNLTTEAQRQAYIRENNVMVAFVGPNGAQSFYPVTYSNGTITVTGITHFSTYAAVEAKNKRVVRMSIEKMNTTINNDAKIIDVPPMIIENRTMVPLRFIGEALGAKVSWVESTQTVTVEQDGKKISLVIGKTGPGLDVPAQIVNSRTLVPVRYVSEQMGAKVNWTELTRTVEIIK